MQIVNQICSLLCVATSPDACSSPILIFYRSFDGQLYLSPIQDPRRILDIGTGTGVWAVEMAE